MDERRAAPAPAAPEVSLELVEGKVAVVVEGRIGEISFDGLQKLGPEPDADGKTRIDIPDVIPNEAGEVSFDSAHAGGRYQARIKVSHKAGGGRTLQLLGVTDAP